MQKKKSKSLYEIVRHYNRTQLRKFWKKNRTGVDWETFKKHVEISRQEYEINESMNDTSDRSGNDNDEVTGSESV